MAERRNGFRSRDRSPPPRARGFSPRYRGREGHSRRIEERDNPDRNFSRRAVGVSDFSPLRHRKRSPGEREDYGRRIEERDNPDRNISRRALGVSDFTPSRDRKRSPGGREDNARRIEERDNRDRNFSGRALGVSVFSPSRHGKYSPGGREDYAQRTEKRGNLDRNFSPRAIGVSDFSPSTHRKRSPGRTEEYSRRIEERDNPDRNFSQRALGVSDFSPSRHGKYSPGGRESYARRIEKRDNPVRNFSPHISPVEREEYSQRIEKRDNPVRNFSQRGLGVSDFSPSRHRNYSTGGREDYAQMNAKRDNPVRNFSTPALGGSEYDYSDRDRHVVGDRSPRRSSGPLRIDTSRYTSNPDYRDAANVENKDVVNAGHLMRLHDEDLYRVGSSFNKFKWDHLLDGPRKPEYNGVGDRDYYYPRDCYLDSVSQYPDSTRAVSLKYENEERMPSHSYTLPVTNLRADGSSQQLPSVVSRYLNVDTNKLHLEKRDGGSHDDQEGRFLEKKKDTVGYLDGFLGTGGERVGEEKCSLKNEYSFPSSHGYLKGDSNYMAPSYQPSNYVSGIPAYSTTARDHNVLSHRSQGGSGLTAQPIDFDGYKENMENMLPSGNGGQLNDTRSASRVYTEEKQFGSSGIGSLSTRLDDVEDYRDLHVSRNDVFNHADDKCFHKKLMKDDRQWDPYSFSRVRSTPNELDASRLLHTQNQELCSSQLNFAYGPESRVDSGDWSHVERSDILQPSGYETDPLFGRYHESLRNTSGLVDLGLDENFERRLKNKHLRDEILGDQDVGIRIAADGNGARKIYKENDFLDLSKKLKSSKADYEETWRGSGHIEDDRPTTSIFHPSRFCSRDLKKRLGPVPRKLHVSQRLMRKYKPSVKGRLALAPRQKKRANLPRVKNLSFNVTSNVQDSDGSPRDYEGGNHLPLEKPEPPEKSKDFKQLVQSAFFKFLKQINETPMKRKMYMEQRKAGSLKCAVCGSTSDEFLETESLARHAFSSKRVGLRSQHLGLHKALCRLMGWKTVEDPGSEWVCEVMSNAAASAQKEDLIIWPPVVIVYNSSIGIKSPGEQFIVSTDELDKKLQDMGFRSIVKVCNGKPANQSVMLVKFNGTLSGLKEAERCHKRYLESNHGRSALKHLKPAQVIISPERGEDCFLYGHLGIVEDIDKLDSETKKRCVLRSKKEILSIGGTPLGENTCS